MSHEQSRGEYQFVCRTQWLTISSDFIEQDTSDKSATAKSFPDPRDRIGINLPGSNIGSPNFQQLFLCSGVLSRVKSLVPFPTLPSADGTELQLLLIN
jgi:hypothetical protein